MKVIHATEIDIGGTATVMNLLMRSQVANEHISSCLCVAPERIIDSLDSKLIQNVSIFKRPERSLLSLFYFAKALIKATWHNKPDIIHLHSTFAGIIGRIILIIMKPLRNPKVVYCPHGFSFLMEGSALKKSIFSTIEIALSYATDKIICVSQFEKNAAIKAGIPDKKICVIYNGTPALKSEHTSGTSPYLTQNTSRINYLFAGRLDKAKGFDILIAAMQKVTNNNIHLTVAGISVSEVPEHAKLNNITYLGWMNSRDLTPYFTHADALVLPSRWEGFPMVVLEAMSLGIPVIASNCTSLSEAVNHGVTGILFNVSDSDKLSDIISNTSIDDLHEMGRSGLERFNENFTSELMTLATSNLYTQLLSKHSKNITTKDIA
ncbi:glycosyltransferase [Pseudomonas psychrophila]|uniref:glycosyltransferase n=1 Tax=Pseudomonas psychrophila TaxID=122355 RepID=UPI0038036B6D